MAVTQIIGPRIAPLWADPVEWTSTRAYEPYTFVTYQGDSYCSRQDTPIGIDITNDDYWVKVSDYNAQAVALQRSMTQTIETAETNMDNTIQTGKNDITKAINDAETSMQQSVADYNAQAVALQRSMTQTIETAETNMDNTIQTGKNDITKAINDAETSMQQSVADVNEVKSEFQQSLDIVNTVKTNGNDNFRAASKYDFIGTFDTFEDSGSWGITWGIQGATYFNGNAYFGCIKAAGDETGRIYRVPNFPENTTPDAYIQLSANSHANSLVGWNHFLFVADTGNAALTIIDTDTFSELSTRLSLSVPNQDSFNVNNVGIMSSSNTEFILYGAAYFGNYTVQARVTYSDEKFTVQALNLMPKPQEINLYQDCCCVDPIYFELVSFKTYSDGYEFLNSTYILVCDPFMPQHNCCISLPFTSEAEGLFAIDNNIYVILGDGNIYTIGDATEYMVPSQKSLSGYLAVSYARAQSVCYIQNCELKNDRTDTDGYYIQFKVPDVVYNVDYDLFYNLIKTPVQFELIIRFQAHNPITITSTVLSPGMLSGFVQYGLNNIAFLNCKTHTGTIPGYIVLDGITLQLLTTSGITGYSIENVPDEWKPTTISVYTRRI